MASLTWTGLDELKLILMALPDRLVGEATAIVSLTAKNALSEMGAAYSRGSGRGNLAKGLVIEEQSLGRYGVGYRVRNRAPHAWWFENGTEARHTSKGVPRGAMFGGPRKPPGNVFIPVAVRRRAEMYRQLRAMLESEGLIVTGDAS